MGWAEKTLVGVLRLTGGLLLVAVGALVLYLSFDVRRYLPVVRCLAVLGIAFGVGMIGLDCAVGLPPAWVVGEGPFIIALGTALLWLAARTGREMDS